MNFLIQTIEGEIKHDFSFTLLEAIRYQNWINHDQGCTYLLINEKMPAFRKDGIPVGSVEFVSHYLETHFNKKPMPRNIPDPLIPFADRLVFNDTEKGLIDKYFVKSNEKIKGFADIVSPGEPLAPGNYQFSELIDIESEWRCFVYQGKLVGLQNYSGDFTMFPDIKKIARMIEGFVTAPIAYTLDVGINKGGTFVIEVHDFFSCGLYGFADLRILPFMFSRWFLEFIQS